MTEQEPKTPEVTNESYTRMTAEIYDAIYAFKDYEGEARKIKELIHSYKKTPGNVLLDVACGTGLHLPYLVDEFEISGVDLSSEQVRAARQRLPNVQFDQGDMRTFQLDKKFDIVTCLFSSIGYVYPLPEMEKAVENMSNHLNIGGVLIIEPWLLPGVFDPSRPPHEQTGTLGNGLTVTRTAYNRGVVDNRSVMDMHHLIEGPNVHEEFTEHHELASYSDNDFKQAYEKAGLEFHYDEEGLSGRGVFIGVKY